MILSLLNCPLSLCGSLLYHGACAAKNSDFILHYSFPQPNTFQAMIATDTARGQIQSYAIFLYSELEWLDENGAIGVLDGHSNLLFVFGCAYCIIEELLKAPPSGVLVASLDKYWYHKSVTATQDAMGQKETSKLSVYSAKLHRPLEVLQESIDLYLE